MSSNILFQLSGLALLISAPLAIVGFALHPHSHALEYLTLPAMIIAHVILTIAGFFGLIGLPGLYVLLANRLGLAGLTGVVLAFLALLYEVVDMGFDAFTVPVIASRIATQYLVAPGGILASGPLPGVMGLLRFPLFLLGFMLFGLAILRSGFRERWGGLLLPFGYLLYAIANLFGHEGSSLGPLNPIGSVILHLGLAWLGYGLLRETQSTTRIR